MAKPVLGRGLGNLLNGAKAPPSPERPESPVNPSPGLAGILRGAPAPDRNGGTPPAPASGSRASQGRKRLLQVSLVAADLLLVGLAVRLVYSAHGPLGWVGLGLCCVAVLGGAWLTCLAFWMD